MREIGRINSEHFLCVIQEDDDLRVFFKADGDIDADGANGQNGAPAPVTRLTTAAPKISPTVA
jgi:hypothetical protein